MHRFSLFFWNLEFSLLELALSGADVSLFLFYSCNALKSRWSMWVLTPLYHVFHETQMAMAMAVVITKVATRAGAVVYAVKVRITAFLDIFYYSIILYFALSLFYIQLCHR